MKSNERMQSVHLMAVDAFELFRRLKTESKKVCFGGWYMAQLCRTSGVSDHHLKVPAIKISSRHGLSRSVPCKFMAAFLKSS